MDVAGFLGSVINCISNTAPLHTIDANSNKKECIRNLSVALAIGIKANVTNAFHHHDTNGEEIRIRRSQQSLSAPH